MIRRAFVVEMICALFIFLFIYAALTKIIDFQKFQVELGKSPILNVFAGIMVYVVPVSEIVIACALAYKQTQFWALHLAFTLMVCFSAYIVAILKFGSYIPCSCGGILQNMTWLEHLFFNIVFVGLGGLAIIFYPIGNQDLIRDKKGSLHP